MTIKGNESWWALLQRVFDLAAIHGGFDPSKLQAQFGSAVVDGNRNLQLEEPRKTPNRPMKSPSKRSHDIFKSRQGHGTVMPCSIIPPLTAARAPGANARR